MKKAYEVGLVNPKSNEECRIIVLAEPPPIGACLHAHVQATIAKSDLPPGFMFLGNGVRPASLH